MNDSIEFVSVIAGLFGSVIALIVGVTVYNLNEIEAKQKMVASGASPLDARCAFASSDDPICLTLKR